MEERRLAQERLALKTKHKRTLQDRLTKVLDVDPNWWGESDSGFALEEASDEEDGEREDSDLYVSVPSIMSIRSDRILWGRHLHQIIPLCLYSLLIHCRTSFKP